MKKRYVISIITVLIITLSLFIYNKLSQKEEIIDNKGIAIYLQDENNEDNYVLSELKTIPTEGYVLNVEKTNSLCSGVTFTYDEETNNISLLTNKSVKCNLYFDIDACSIAPETVVVDTSTAGETEFTPVCDGKYKLEVWGAQGGSYDTTIGGYGGYSVGVTTLAKNETLYVNVGGSGTYRLLTDTAAIPDSYNGGTGAYNDTRFNTLSGGGLTHIATVTKSGESGKTGELRYLEEYKGTLVNNEYYVSDVILIVAGGGGAAENENAYLANGGSGGGYKGQNGTQTGSYSVTIQGGTQTEAAQCYTSYTNKWYGSSTFGAGFGFGTNGRLYGPGGGWYGGMEYCNPSGGSSSGGSGYIASSRLTSSNGITKHMYCHNCGTTQTNTEYATTVGTCHNQNATPDCAKEGSGHARITYLGN